MQFLRDRDFYIGFGTGFTLHVILVITRAGFFPLRCLGKCSNITNWDMPVSLLYYAFSDAKLIVASLFIGSVYWGFLFWGILNLFKKYLAR